MTTAELICAIILAFAFALLELPCFCSLCRARRKQQRMKRTECWQRPQQGTQVWELQRTRDTDATVPVNGP